MSEESGFSMRQITSFVLFIAVGTVLGVGAYQTGLSMAGSGSGASVTAISSTIPDGEALYIGNCAGCHGGKGEGGVGVALNTAATWSAAEFKKAVLKGETPTKTLAPTMPRFQQTGLDGAPATQAQIAAISAYIKTLK